MAIFKLVEGLTYAADAGADLSSSINRFCKLNSDGEVVLCGDDEKPVGSIFEAGGLGAPISIQMGGICKVIASAGITAGQRVACAANGLAKAGTTNPVGIALNTVVTSGLVSVAMVY